jgi:hypothetical protein
MNLLSLLPFIWRPSRHGIAGRDMPPQSYGNDVIAGIFGKPSFDFRNYCGSIQWHFSCHYSR